jgi:hypothetical protein
LLEDRDVSSDVDAVEEEPDGSVQARVERLEAENTRLRARLESGVTYRRVAGLFLAAAAIFLGGTQLFPSSEGVLLALAGTGVFGAVLLLALTSEPLVPAAAAGAVTDTMSQNLSDVSRAMGIDGHATYVPTSTGDVRMYLSAAAYDRVPTVNDQDNVGTIYDEPDAYGLLLEPTGRHLLAVLEERATDLPEDAEAALPMLIEAATDYFELAESLETVSADESVVSGGSHVTIRISGTAFGNAADLDHPIPSLVGVGLATIIDEPVETKATTTDDGTTLVTFGWQDGPAIDLQ